MTCPACNGALEELHVGDMTADACVDGCGGVWLDRGELGRVDEEHHDAGALLDLRAGPSVAVDHELRRNCPRCPAIVMMRRHTSVRRDVAIDECAACGGIWLDAGELAAIRAEADVRRRHREQVDEAFASLSASTATATIPPGTVTEHALLAAGDFFEAIAL